MKKLLFGMATNDADYHVNPRVNGKIVSCPFYQAWVNMIRRGFSNSEKERYPTYRDVSVCAEWLLFSNFKSWMANQDWSGNHLDKDIIMPGNKIYSPHGCAFVTPSTNMFLTDRSNNRGKYKIGVCWHVRIKKFHSKVSNPFTGKREHLGYFDDEESAYKAWKSRKHQIALMLADIEKDDRVAAALRVRFS